jgi:hypothetical protein
MNDRIFESFLKTQLAQGTALAAASDRFDLVPLGGDPPRKYLVHFHCTGLVKTADGAIVEHDEFVAGIWFQDDHLRAVDPKRFITLLEPAGIFHPNLAPPFVCMGHVGVGMTLVEAIYQLHAIITYANAAFDDALNPEAAAWARDHQERFPLDRRPLKRVIGAPVEPDTSAVLDFDVMEIGS